ncbi:MAG TPA: hypothetical protein ENH85_02910 [Candidatus Scalindua sp.]|nr:hypothetical protein [Candidatus Scalindua sp.]
MKNLKEIIEKEGLKNWSIKTSNSGAGLTIFKTKEILIKDPNNMAMFLHEVAHAKTGKGHDGIWADEFTELVRKYIKTLKEKICSDCSNRLFPREDE